MIPMSSSIKHLSSLAYLEMQMIISTLLLRYDINILVDELVTTEGFVRKVETLPVKIRKL